MPPSLATLLDGYQPEGSIETADILRVRALAEAADDPWRRDLPLHVTASALITHPATGRVLLRWHQRQQAWLQVGGHGDPGEGDPLAIARREAGEETGLADLTPWPDAEIRHVVIVNVPAGNGEPAHEHADIRYFMATQAPDAARAENENAPLRWLSLASAQDVTAEANLRETLARMERLLTLAQSERERVRGRDVELPDSAGAEDAGQTGTLPMTSSQPGPFSLLRLTGAGPGLLRRVIVLESAVPLPAVAAVAIGAGSAPPRCTRPWRCTSPWYRQAPRTTS